MIRRHFKLDPSQIPVSQHFTQYASVLGKRARVKSLAPGTWQFLGPFEAFQYDGVEVVWGHHSGMEYDRPITLRDSGQPLIAVTYCFEGQIALSYNNDAPAQSRPGQVVVSNADSRAQVVAEDAVRFITLYFHETGMLTARLLTETLPSLEVAVPKELWSWLGSTLDQLRVAMQQGNDVSAATLIKVVEVVIDQLSVPRVAALRPVDEDRMLAIQAFVDQHAKDDDLGVAVLCQRFHMSRATLYRHMAPFGGVKRYLQNRRLSLCFDEMRRGHEKGDGYYRTLALAFQFRSFSDFCQRYQQQFGVDPRLLLQSRGEVLTGSEATADTIFRFESE